MWGTAVNVSPRVNFSSNHASVSRNEYGGAVSRSVVTSLPQSRVPSSLMTVTNYD